MEIPGISSVLRWIYRIGLAIDRMTTRKLKLPKPVVSVGNIALGGRAKTPLVVFIAKLLQSHGFEPVVLTRGYGRKKKDLRVFLTPGSKKNFSEELCGDEALEIFLRAKVPVLVGSARARNALDFLKLHPFDKPYVFILDDGFQHWQLERDFDLVLVKEEDLSSSVLPMGILRESKSALERADLVLELGRDFSKKTFLKLPPNIQESVIVLCTRAPDLDYKRFFTETFKNPYFVNLRDHASSVKMEHALSNFHESMPVILGAKEATKMFTYSEMITFMEEGHFSKRLSGGNLRHFYFADYTLWFHDPGIIEKRLFPFIGEK